MPTQRCCAIIFFACLFSPFLQIPASTAHLVRHTLYFSGCVTRDSADMPYVILWHCCLSVVLVAGFRIRAPPLCEVEPLSCLYAPLRFPSFNTFSIWLHARMHLCAHVCHCTPLRHPPGHCGTRHQTTTTTFNKNKYTASSHTVHTCTLVSAQFIRHNNREQQQRFARRIYTGKITAPKRNR